MKYSSLALIIEPIILYTLADFACRLEPDTFGGSHFCSNVIFNSVVTFKTSTIPSREADATKRMFKLLSNYFH